LIAINLELTYDTFLKRHLQPRFFLY